MSIERATQGEIMSKLPKLLELDITHQCKKCNKIAIVTLDGIKYCIKCYRKATNEKNNST